MARAVMWVSLMFGRFAELESAVRRASYRERSIVERREKGNGVTARRADDDSRLGIDVTCEVSPLIANRG
jgi:hypothetical protein